MNQPESSFKQRSKKSTIPTTVKIGAINMENEILKTDKKSEQHRVVISAAANSLLEQARLKIINGAEDVELSKSDLANYVFENIERMLTESDARTLRSDFFDESKFLESLRKRKAEGQELPPHIRKAIREHLTERDQPKKRSAVGDKLSEVQTQ